LLSEMTTHASRCQLISSAVPHCHHFNGRPRRSFLSTIHLNTSRALTRQSLTGGSWKQMFSLFLLNNPATTEIYTLSLHDALPICGTSASNPGHMEVIIKCEPLRPGLPPSRNCGESSRWHS